MKKILIFRLYSATKRWLWRLSGEQVVEGDLLVYNIGMHPRLDTKRSDKRIKQGQKSEIPPKVADEIWRNHHKKVRFRQILIK